MKIENNNSNNNKQGFIKKFKSFAKDKRNKVILGALAVMVIIVIVQIVLQVKFL